MKIILLAASIMLISPMVFATDKTVEPSFQHPVIKDHGGIVVLPQASYQPQRNAKVLLDIVSEEKSGSVLKGLDRAALILNQYTQAGAGIENGFKMAIVLHGPATKAALSKAAYAKHTEPYNKDKKNDKNFDLELIKELKEAGVDIFVCGQAMAHHGYATSEVTPEVALAVSAATVCIRLQMDGYAYIPFK